MHQLGNKIDLASLSIATHSPVMHDAAGGSELTDASKTMFDMMKSFKMLTRELENGCSTLFQPKSLFWIRRTTCHSFLGFKRANIGRLHVDGVVRH